LGKILPKRHVGTVFGEKGRLNEWGLAHKIQHFVKNEKSGREALVYKQGT
jgi:hypothetical protein